MAKKFNIKTGVSIHNRFDFYKLDPDTREEIHLGCQAENIVLDAMYAKLLSRASNPFGYIFFGTGTGTLSPARTSLFTHLGYKAVTHDSYEYDLPVSWTRKKIVLNPEEYVGSILTEIGVAYGTTTTNLITHALIKDMNGNPITLTKGALDVIVIYATLYFTLSTNNGVKFTGFLNYLSESYVNPLLKFLATNQAFPNVYLYTGASIHSSKLGQNTPGLMSRPIFESASLSWVVDTPNKKMSISQRIAVSESNNILTELCIGNDGSNNNNPSGIVSVDLQNPNAYLGMPVIGVQFGVGDGVTTIFELPSPLIDETSIDVYVDGTPSTPTIESYQKFINVTRIGDMLNGSNYLECYDAIQISDDWNTMAIYDSNDIRILQFVDGGYVRKYTIPRLTETYTVRAITVSNDFTKAVCQVDGPPYIEIHSRVGDIWTQDETPFEVPLSSILLYNPNYKNIFWISNDGNLLCINRPNPTLDDGEVLIYRKLDGQWKLMYSEYSSQQSYPFTCIASDDNSSIMLLKMESGAPNMIRYLSFTGSSYTASESFDESYKSNGSIWMNRAGTISAYILTDAKTIRVRDLVGGFWVARADFDPTILYGVFAQTFYITEDGNTMYVLEGSTYKCFKVIWDGDSWALIGTITHNDSGPSSLDAVFVNSDQTSIRWSTFGYDIHRKYTKVTFPSPPALNAVLTADYTVQGIHKTDQRVIDVDFSVTFGEVT